MFYTQLASQSEMRLEQMDNGSTEIKWCIFTKGLRAPIAKIIVDTHQKKVQDDHEPVAHIVNVFVRPEFRGKHLGEHLVRLAQIAMRENGFFWMTLEAEEKVEHYGRLVSLYDRCGFHIYPVMDNYPMEYNGDECYRKVPMRCKLADLQLDNEPTTPPRQSAITHCSPPSSPRRDLPTTTTTTTTTCSPPVRSYSPFSTRFTSVPFVEEMKRESIYILQACSFNVDVILALDWIDQHLCPGTMEHAFRTGMHIRALGHPDWMELAGYLRHVGRIQEKWTNWHAPFMVQIPNSSSRGRKVPLEVEEHATSSDDESDDHGNSQVKSGPLPHELCEEGKTRTFVDPEHYSQQGVDESVLTWGPNEYAYLSLTYGNRTSSPHEMAQVLRYCDSVTWLNTEDFGYLESWGDADVKQLTLRFKSAMDEADQASLLTAKQMEEARGRVLELVDKYVSDVRLM
jgi:hypothetical protein